MLRKQKNEIFEKGTGTIIGEGIILEGASLVGTGAIRIDGRFSGNISIDGHIILGETGIIYGDVKADSAMFAGKYEGNATIKNALHLTSTANLSGYVDTGKIIIDENAVFNGTCNTTSPSSSADNAKRIERISQNESIPTLSLNESKLNESNARAKTYKGRIK